MTKKCPQCQNLADLSKVNKFRPFCSERGKLIDLGTWANEAKLIRRPMESDEFYDE